DFDGIRAGTPLLADRKPWGRFTAPDMDRAGGIMLVLRRLLDAGLLKADAPTVTGRTIGEEARAARETAGQDVVRPLERPIATHGGLVILRGSLAPDGCGTKVAGHDTPTRTFTATGCDREVGPGELARRRATWRATEPRYKTGALAKYARLVGSAAEGAVTSA